MLNLFLKKSPFVRLIIPVITGIMIAFQIPEMKNELAVFSVITLLIFLGIRYWIQTKKIYKYRYLSGIVGFMLLFFWAAFYMQLRMPQIFSVGDTAVLKVQLIEHIGETEKNNKYEAQLLNSQNDSLKQISKQRGIIFIPKKLNAHQLYPGDVISAFGWFIPFSEPDSQFDFDYSGYLRNQRIAFRYFVNDYQKSSNENINLNLFILSARLKHYLRQKFTMSGMSESPLAI
jgi:hypothetical protein